MMMVIVKFLPRKLAEGTKLLNETLAIINEKEYGTFPHARNES